MTIDNFDIIREHLDFIDTKLDRYVVHILRRPKDISAEMKNTLGANESQRLIKTYYIDSLEYFDRKREAIKELCRANNARAYIIVQPKDNFECLINLGEKIFETIRNKNYSVKPEHLMRQAFCEWHKTRKKQWILDLDEDSMDIYPTEALMSSRPPTAKSHWTLDDVIALVKKHLKLVGKNEDEVYVVPTKNGHHVIASPFNLAAAQKECPMLFEGVKSFEYKVDCGPGEYVTKTTEKKVGWLHKDGMTLLYMESND